MTIRTLKKIFANLDVSKTEELEDGTIKVWGYASSGAEDSAGETVTSDAMKAALPDYLKWGAVREMHQAKAAGTAIEAEVQEDGKTWFGAHIVDSEAVKKVQTGVYKGFSIGGKVTARDDLNKTIIKGLKLIEVSLVDRPANPEAVLTMYKAEGIDEEEVSAVDQLADLLNKGTITPEKLLELAKGGTKPQESETELAKTETSAAKDMTAGVMDCSALSAIEGVIVVDGEALEKGMYSLQEFASVLTSLGWMCESAQYESDWEGDNSPIPAQLRAWLVSGIQIFKDMAAEETAELVAQLKAQAGDVDVIALAARGIDLAKAGKKFSKATKDALGAIHKAAQDACDHLGKLGYAEAEEEDEDAGKAATVEDLAKAGKGSASDLAKAVGMDVTAAWSDVLDKVSELTKAASERDELQKRVTELEAKPAPGKALLKAISKGGDVVDAGDDTNKVEPVKDHKGDVNDVATLIKAIHSGKV